MNIYLSPSLWVDYKYSKKLVSVLNCTCLFLHIPLTKWYINYLNSIYIISGIMSNLKLKYTGGCSWAIWNITALYVSEGTATDFGSKRGPGAKSPWILRNDCVYTTSIIVVYTLLFLGHKPVYTLIKRKGFPECIICDLIQLGLTSKNFCHITKVPSAWGPSLQHMSFLGYLRLKA
jgi:hypothetical protein